VAYIIEKISEKRFDDFIHDNVLVPCSMKNSGYYQLDRLPQNTATGDIRDGVDGAYKSNIFSIPIAGSGDGGCYTCAEDMVLFWKHLLSFDLLAEGITRNLLAEHVTNGSDDSYGLGVWINQHSKNIIFVQGFDPGARFFSFHNKSNRRTLTIFTNNEYDIGSIIGDLWFALAEKTD